MKVILLLDAICTVQFPNYGVPGAACIPHDLFDCFVPLLSCTSLHMHISYIVPLSHMSSFYGMFVLCHIKINKDSMLGKKKSCPEEFA